MSTLASIKTEIWYHPKIKANRINLQVAADKAEVTLPITDPGEAQRLLKALNKPQRKTTPISDYTRKRYQDAHRAWVQRTAPHYYAAGYSLPVVPRTSTANGLQRFIVNHLEWMGCHGNRINTAGRQIFDKKKNRQIWIKGTTKKGTGDTVNCISGAMVVFEVKIGADTPSDDQLEQQAKIQSSDGYYYFVKTADEYLFYFDKHYKHGANS